MTWTKKRGGTSGGGPAGGAGGFRVAHGYSFAAGSFYSLTGITAAEYANINSVPTTLGALIYPTQATMNPEGDFLGNRADAGSGGVGPCYLYAQGGAPRVRAGATGSGGQDLTAAVNLVPGKVNAVVMTVQGASVGQRIRLFVNGVLSASVNRTFAHILGQSRMNWGFSPLDAVAFPTTGIAGAFLCPQELTPADVAAWSTELREAGGFVVPSMEVQPVAWCPRLSAATYVPSISSSTLDGIRALSGSGLGITVTKVGLADCAF